MVFKVVDSCSPIEAHFTVMSMGACTPAHKLILCPAPMKVLPVTGCPLCVDTKMTCETHSNFYIDVFLHQKLWEKSIILCCDKSFSAWFATDFSGSCLITLIIFPHTKRIHVTLDRTRSIL